MNDQAINFRSVVFEILCRQTDRRRQKQYLLSACAQVMTQNERALIFRRKLVTKQNKQSVTVRQSGSLRRVGVIVDTEKSVGHC